MPKTKKTKVSKEKRPHWLSREVERFTTPVLTAVALGVIYFAYDWLVVEPEHAQTVRTVEQHEELLNLLSQSVAQQSKSITSLATDRAGAVYGGASRAIEQLEADNIDKPFDDWSVQDQRLYEAAMTQRDDAAKRLGID